MSVCAFKKTRSLWGRERIAVAKDPAPDTGESPNLGNLQDSQASLFLLAHLGAVMHNQYTRVTTLNSAQSKAPATLSARQREKETDTCSGSAPAPNK